MGEGASAPGDSLGEAVLDTAIQAVNEASASDFLRFLTPDAIADAMDATERISASTVRRHFQPARLGSTARELQTQALIERVQSWAAPLGETRDRLVSGRDALESFCLQPYETANEQACVAGVDGVARLAIAAADTDELARTTLQLAFMNLAQWVRPALVDDPSQGIRAFGIAALRFADVMSSRLTRAGASPRASASGALRAMGAMAGTGTEDVEYARPIEPLPRMVRRTKHAQVEGRDAAIVTGALRVVAAAPLDDFLSFLTPTRIQSLMRVRADRTTVAYHFVRAPSPPVAQGRAVGLLELIDRRIGKLSEEEMLGGHSFTMWPGGTPHAEIDAKRRLRLLDLAAGDRVFAGAESLLETLQRRSPVFVNRKTEASAFADFLRRHYDALWFLEVIGLGRDLRVDSSRSIPGVARLVGHLLGKYGMDEWPELSDAIVDDAG